jgi:uncharacterized protein YbjT (DUF2867 family)
VRALVRPGVAPERLADLRALGVSIETVDFGDAAALARACAGGSCVVSALSGLRAVIVDAQSALLDAAVAAACRGSSRPTTASTTRACRAARTATSICAPTSARESTRRPSVPRRS